MGSVIGIDLGTTYSAASILREDGFPEILKNSDGESTTPSVVLFQSFDGVDEPLVGTMAKHSAASDPEHVVQFVKRQMGNAAWRFESDSGNSYSAEEVSALILKKIKQDAELALGNQIDGAVITVPAYFDDSRRIATKHAGEIAGLNVLRVLNEPTAAAISFGLDAEGSGTVLVYDLGGGTFDVTLLQIENSSFSVIGTDGDRNLGGFDFDNELIKLVMADLEKQGAHVDPNDFQLTAELREKCELAKRALSNVEKTSVHVSIDGKSYRCVISREAFERVTASLLRRTEDLVEDVLADTGYSWDRIDHLVLVGGSTRMPMVRNLMKCISGKEPELDVNPDEAVALGAAVQAALEVVNNSPIHEECDAPIHSPNSPIYKVTVSDVASQALGVVLLDDDGQREYNEVVIPRNASVPGTFEQVVSTIVDNQKCVNVRVTQGDDEDLAFVVVIGSATIDLPQGLPKKSPLRLVYSYDIEQTVHVELFDYASGASLGEFSVQRAANYSDQELSDAIQKIREMRVN